QVSNAFMKPVILIVLIGVAIYTFTKKDFGAVATKNVHPKKAFIYGCIISCVLGFYDGFIGPGAGSFLVMAFISVLGY
ncbi:TSUP family transporter, partial [Parvimonas sp. M13]|uniref:TSUP family transporter n=1 Tax=Parvimonas sp. M13 TaxID=3110694 RepID=UPI002B495D9D